MKPLVTQRARHQAKEPLCRSMLVLVVVTVVACSAPRSAPGLRVDSVSGHLRLEAESIDERTNTAGKDSRQKEESIREELLLALSGFYYHPKLVDYELTTEFALDQRDIDSEGDKSKRSVDAQNLNYEFRAKLFKDQPYAGEIYTNKNTMRSRQTFFSTVETTTQATGASLFAREWWIPTRINAEQYSYRGEGVNTFREDRDTLLAEGTRVEDGARYQYRAEYNDVSLGVNPQDYTNLNVSASSTHSFGAEQRNRWSNNVRWRKQSGSVDSRTFGAASTYHGELAENLWTDDTLQYQKTATQGFSTESINFSPGISHQLFDSLTSSLVGRVGRSDFDGGQVDTYGALTQLTYRKKTPLGRLDMRYSLDYYEQDQQTDGGAIQVTDETHVFTPGDPLFLDSVNIVESTIVVTDITGLIIYTLGIDYLVSREGTRTRIDIPIGSIISPEETLLFDYSFQPDPDLRFSNTTQTAHVGMNVFDYADWSYTHSTTDQTRISGIDSGTLDDTTRTVAIARVYPFGATLGFERETFDSNQIPFKRNTWFGFYEIPVWQDVSWRVSASTFRTTFDDQAGDETGTTAGTSLFATLGRNLTASLRGEWRDIDYRTDNGTAKLVETSVTWHFRQTELSLEGRFIDEEFEIASDQRRTAVRLSFTRRF